MLPPPPLSYAHIHPFLFLSQDIQINFLAVRRRMPSYLHDFLQRRKIRLSTRLYHETYPKVIFFSPSWLSAQPTRLALFFKKNLLSLLRGLEALLLSGEKSVDGSVELVAAVEEVELHHEEEADQVASELADERTGSGGGSTCRVELAGCSQGKNTSKSQNLPVAIMSSTMMTF
jgi:hypothetical protein